MRARRLLLIASLSLAACGKTHALSDAGTGDGNGADAASTIDGAVDADPSGPVTVTVFQGYSVQGLPIRLAGAPVVFVDPDGHVVAEVPTDANGVASASVLAGASVTAVYGSGTTDRKLETVLGVKPGDQIELGPLGAPSHEKTSATFTANVADDPGSLSYEVYGPCGASSGSAAGSGARTPIVLSMYPDCTAGTMDLVAIAYNSDGNPSDSVAQNGVANSGGGSVDLPATWQPFQQLTATYASIPTSDVSQISLSTLVPDRNGFGRSGSTFSGAASQMIQLSVPAAATASMQSVFYGTTGARQLLFEIVDGTKTAYDVDVNATLLPWLGVPAVDAGAGKITIAVTGTGAIDAQDALILYSRTDASQVQTTFSWEVWGATAGDVALPALPTDLADDRPLATDRIDYTWAALIEADAIASYDDVRGHLFGAGYYGNTDALLGTGRLRVSTGELAVGLTRASRRR